MAELFPTTPEPEPQPEPAQQTSSLVEKLKVLSRNKVLVISSVLFLVMSMGLFIVISPATKENKIAVATFLPTSTPTLSPTLTPAPPTITPTKIPTPTFTPTPTIPPGTSWKTYSNTQYGYRIKYSPDWVVKDLGELEPKIPSYINFYPSTASESSRFITIGATTRTYEEQLALGASSSAITVAGIKGTKQSFQDSDGNTSTVVILPRSTHLLVFRAKTEYLTYLDLMLSTLYVAK